MPDLDKNQKRLIADGRERGYITHQQIQEVLPDHLQTADDIEAWVAPIVSSGAAIVESAPRAKKQRRTKPAGSQPRSADPVQSYFRDIGDGELLTREQEVALAKRMEAGRAARWQAALECSEAVAELSRIASEIRAGAITTRAALAEDDHLEPADVAQIIRSAISRKNAQRRIEHLDTLALSEDIVERVLSAARCAEDAGVRAAIRAADRDVEAARRRLVECNLRLVISIARRYQGRGLSLSDLIQEGNIGLMRAVDKFNHHLGFKMSTYAHWWIRQSINRAIGQVARTIRVPIHALEASHKIRRAKRELEHDLDREPTATEVAEHLGMRLQKVRSVLELPRTIALETQVGEDGAGELGDLIPDDSAEMPDEVVSALDESQKLRRMLDYLKPRERDVLCLRFGIGAREEMTLETIGARMGVTRERVRQIQMRAIKRLRRVSRAQRFRAS